MVVLDFWISWLVLAIELDKSATSSSIRAAGETVSESFSNFNDEKWNAWTYRDTISGPDFWGMKFNEAELCYSGRQQSPINIDPTTLLYDKVLQGKDLEVGKGYFSVELFNDGHWLEAHLPRIRTTTRNTEAVEIEIDGGPLIDGYVYYFHNIIFRVGKSKNEGSEHRIGNKPFPAEVQIYAWNKMYKSFANAVKQPNGIVAIAVLVHIDDSQPNPMLSLLINGTKRSGGPVSFKSDLNNETTITQVNHFNLHELLPVTKQYVTYDGSLSYPPCYESVRWVILNKPIYASNADLDVLRRLHATKYKNVYEGPLMLTNNYRPLSQVNSREIRTNIQLKLRTPRDGKKCRSPVEQVVYKTNPNFPWPYTRMRRYD